MDKLITHLAKVNQKAEAWPDWKKSILDSKVSNAYEIGDTFYETFTNHRINFLKEVDLAIKEYFMYKYN